MVAGDPGTAPTDCQRSLKEGAERIADLGAAAILAFDGNRHVGQLQFRRRRPQLRSAAGIFADVGLAPGRNPDVVARGPLPPRSQGSRLRCNRACRGPDIPLAGISVAFNVISRNSRNVKLSKRGGLDGVEQWAQ